MSAGSIRIFGEGREGVERLVGVDAVPVGGVGVADGELARVILGLADALVQCLAFRLGLDHGQLSVAIDQHIIRDVRLAAPPVALDAACGDAVFAEDSTALNDAPACGFQGGVNQFSAGFGFVHGRWLVLATGLTPLTVLSIASAP
jgi:hypothetical protein